jgi:membrane-associated phospholipid phosphatase
MEVVRALRESPAWLTDVAEGITFLGDSEFYLLAFPLLYWSVSRRLGLQLGVILLLSASVNAILKLALHTPRPLFLEPELGVVEESSYGLPSGHSQNAMAMWGLLAVELRTRVAAAACGLLILALAWSRLQLGVHHPLDTVVGLGVGALLLVAYLRWRGPIAAWLASQPPWRRIAVALATSLGLLALAVIARVALAGSSIPADWIGADPGDPPFSLESAVVATGALFGIVAGAVLVHERGGFETDGTWWRRALRYPLGLFGVAVLWLGFGDAPTGDDVVALAVRYVQYALIGLWIGGLAPLVFVRLGLAPIGRQTRAVATRP